MTPCRRSSPRASRANKLVAGVPFFGRGWRGVGGAGRLDCRHRVAAGRRLQSIADTFLKTPGLRAPLGRRGESAVAVQRGTKEWISYDDPESMRLKGEYIAAQKLSGAMFWELSKDGGALLDALRSGLASTAR